VRVKLVYRSRPAGSPLHSYLTLWIQSITRCYRRMWGPVASWLVQEKDPQVELLYLSSVTSFTVFPFWPRVYAYLKPNQWHVAGEFVIRVTRRQRHCVGGTIDSSRSLEANVEYDTLLLQTRMLQSEHTLHPSNISRLNRVVRGTLCFVNDGWSPGLSWTSKSAR